MGPGPYDFIATVQHGLATALNPVTTILPTSVVTGGANLIDGGPIPEGLIFNLVAKWHQKGELFTATYSAATVGGTLSFQLALPPETAGKTVQLSITRPEDPGYLAVKSVPANVKVAPAPTKAKPKKKKRRRRHKHRHKHHKHKHHHKHHH